MKIKSIALALALTALNSTALAETLSEETLGDFKVHVIEDDMTDEVYAIAATSYGYESLMMQCSNNSNNVVLKIVGSKPIFASEGSEGGLIRFDKNPAESLTFSNFQSESTTPHDAVFTVPDEAKIVRFRVPTVRGQSRDFKFRASGFKEAMATVKATCK